MRKVSLKAVAGGLILLLAATVQAQFHDPNDLGSTDTAAMVISVLPRAATGQLKVQMDLWVFNDSNDVAGASMGFNWVNSGLKMDSARFSTMTFSAFNFVRVTYEGSSVNLTNQNKRFEFVGARSEGNGVVASPARQVWCRYYFSLTSWSVNDSIILDTNAFNSGATYKFVDGTGKNYRPYWTGKKIIHDIDYVPPSTLHVLPDTLTFTAILGGPVPASQTFGITSTPNSLAFTVVENAGWILKSPATGSTPSTITVSINPTGLPIGAYFDSILVESNNATNSPQVVHVRLNVTPPPPQISVTPTQLFFNGVVGGSNPLPKSLIIKNLNFGSTLNWTTSHSQIWLGLSPPSGTDSGTVTVSIDITGLSYGTFRDTIIVSDPLAVNNPVKVPVTLQLGSNLPVIVADSQNYFFIVTMDELILFSRYITIRNGGGGQLDFTASEDRPYILGLYPNTGTAPQQIEIRYKIPSATEGQQITDTIWITSNQAINSPYPVVVTLRFVADPAYIGLSTDTIKFNVYECSQGLGNLLPTRNLTVQNSGHDDPLRVFLSYSSELFSIDKDSSLAPATFLVSATDPDIPLGTYYDTIWVKAQKAANNPAPVIVQYNRIAGQQPPQIKVSRPSLQIAYFENSGPSVSTAFEINNKFGGCMPWKLQESVPWLTPLGDSGNVPSGIGFSIDAPGYVLGSYPDTIRIFSAGATNSPVVMPVELRVWKLRGDVTWDGRVDIADLVGLVAYQYLGGVGPMPTYFAGDCDCDNRVDLSDITRLVDYLYLDGPVICGNPY